MYNTIHRKKDQNSIYSNLEFTQGYNTSNPSKCTLKNPKSKTTTTSHYYVIQITKAPESHGLSFHTENTIARKTVLNIQGIMASSITHYTNFEPRLDDFN